VCGGEDGRVCFSLIALVSVCLILFELELVCGFGLV
jgi:hypothetical protein